MGVPVGPDQPRLLGSYLPAQAQTWDRIVDKHGLRKTTIADIVGESHYYADFCFAYGAEGPPPPAFVSAVKLRQAGFHDFVDTEDMFRYWLDYLIDKKMLPKFS